MQQWLDWIGGVLGQPGALRAIAVGLVISWNLTQVVKNAPWIVRQSEQHRVATTRLVAFAFGFVPTWLLWPEAGAAAVVLATAVGSAAPAAYKLAARALYHYFPWLELKMSASPRCGGEP